MNSFFKKAANNILLGARLPFDVYNRIGRWCFTPNNVHFEGNVTIKLLLTWPFQMQIQVM